MTTQTLGHFIVIDGSNGAGKTTVLQRLAECLQAEGHEVVVTREPGGTPLAEKIRELILSPVTEHSDQMTLASEVLLFLAARVQHVETRILPELKRGKVVLCDRYSSSTMAFQCFGRGFPVERMLAMERLALGDFGPDKVLILDLDPEEGLRRNSTTGEIDGIEQRGLDFLNRARRGFLWQAEQFPDRFSVIDASDDSDLVFNNALSAVRDMLAPGHSALIAESAGYELEYCSGRKAVERVHRTLPEIKHSTRI